jgi:hypothetical protein
LTPDAGASKPKPLPRRGIRPSLEIIQPTLFSAVDEFGHGRGQALPE